MSSSRRPGASEDSILASLERGSGGTRTHRNWLIVGGSAALLLTLMLAWIAYSNATSVRTLPQSAVKRAVAPADEGVPDPAVPSLNIRAPESAAIIDERTAEPPAMVMLPAEDDGRENAAPVAAQPSEPRALRPVQPARQASAKPAAAPKQIARSIKAPAERSMARAGAQKKPKPAPQPAAAPEVDSDVALISAIVAHSSRHAAERAQQENCTGKKCAQKSSTPP